MKLGRNTNLTWDFSKAESGYLQTDAATKCLN